jgi:hypothetical protein
VHLDPGGLILAAPNPGAVSAGPARRRRPPPNRAGPQPCDSIGASIMADLGFLGGHNTEIGHLRHALP